VTRFSVEISGNPQAVMQYANYEEGIIQCYGIELRGWTYERIVNPSDLSTAVRPLGKLCNAINSGNCKFVKLTAEERHERLEAYKAKIATGEMKACERKQRSDAGLKKRKSKAMVDDSESEDGHDPKHQRKAASDSSSSDSDSD
jgi:hypothetical protein